MRELEDELEAVKQSLVGEMNARQVNEMIVDCFTLRYTTYATNRIDSTSLKKDLPELYDRYTKTSEAKRFSIA